MRTPLSNQQAIVAIFIMAAVTFALRILPFLLFTRRQRSIPRAIEYLGNVLPFSSMILLVVYCLRNVDVSSATSVLPMGLGIVSVAALQAWRRDSTLSIFGGTVIYMVLLYVFS